MNERTNDGRVDGGREGERYGRTDGWTDRQNKKYSLCHRWTILWGAETVLWMLVFAERPLANSPTWARTLNKTNKCCFITTTSPLRVYCEFTKWLATSWLDSSVIKSQRTWIRIPFFSQLNKLRSYLQWSPIYSFFHSQFQYKHLIYFTSNKC